MHHMKPRHVACPTCGAQVAWLPESTFRPFCSARCKGIDLGAWASEQYCVAGPEDTLMAEETVEPPLRQ
jgi:endogenous inhibitor of DNA gyrase (YacG/DUF329 family)